MPKAICKYRQPGKNIDDLMAAYGDQITDLQYPKSLVSNLNERASKIGLIFLVVAIVLCLIVTFSIDNTIRLAMFSNRFLIKTMQMVGATRGVYWAAIEYPGIDQWADQFGHRHFYLIYADRLGREPVPAVKNDPRYQTHADLIWRADPAGVWNFCIQYA
jgi:hypothetical protein